MTATRKEKYNAIVKEFDDYKDYVIESPETDQWLMVMEGELESPTEWFTDVAVRDAVMTHAMEDEKFSFVLCHKIAGKAKTILSNPQTATQADLEALTTLAQVGTMYGHFDNSQFFVEAVSHLAELNNLIKPSLASLTERLLQAQDHFNFEGMRENMVAEMKDKIMEQLEVEA